MSDSAFELATGHTSITSAIAREKNQPAPIKAINKTSQPVVYSINSPDSPRRLELEKYISDKFSNFYGAAIVEFFPLLLARNEGDSICSVVGLRPGTDRPLFLEQYLQTSLEQKIASQAGTRVDREKIMEIGNLASSYKSGNQLMFVLLTAILAKAGYTWVVFTATAQVRSLLQRLEFHPVTLCEADQSRLQNKKQVWGSYYQSRPLVQAGNVVDGLSVLETNHFTQGLLNKYCGEIDSLAHQLCVLRLKNRRPE